MSVPSCPSTRAVSGHRFRLTPRIGTSSSVAACAAPMRWRAVAVAASLAWIGLASSPVLASTASTDVRHTQAAPAARSAARATSPRVPSNSGMDAQTFYQVLAAELELRNGNAGVAAQVLLDAARRSRDETLFRRAVDIAINDRAQDQALAGLKAWRLSLPKSHNAAAMQAQVLMALGQTQEALEPLRATIELAPATDRTDVIEALSGLVMRGDQAAAAATVLDKAVEPWKDNSTTRAAALLASARGWLVAGETRRPLDLAQQVQQLDPGSDGAALIGLELFGKDPRAEALAATYNRAPKASAPIRLIYARRLTAAQRYRDALAVTTDLVTYQPDHAPAWLMRGALQIELVEPEAARTSLTRYIDLKEAPRKQAETRADGEDDDARGESDEAAEAHAAADDQERNQAILMLSQVSEQLKDYEGAQRWLERLSSPPDDTSVVLRRASLLARTGKIDDGRALIRALPERNAEDRRAKVMSETQLLRDARQWQTAYAVLTSANQAQPDDPDLLYEQALLAEKLQRHDEMEALLRRVMTIKPDQQHAYNALGYSLADRGLRLEEARELIRKALALAPGDPFIGDSLGWVEFRLGRPEEALRILKGVYEQRPDVEIGAHLGEVLWSLGRRDEALQVWRAGQQRDAANEVLAETLSRLKVRL
ncbi:tetratricopeptide repeat protein [Leptothrix discophora]|uniref:Tetratricopeptide repeat protein n=1 Tax=Leptothrix discophora TaxID=89 RepID=A0ABT9G4D2_LEPDI|nr:tetratricopeptide repeat protein [Leptothrix discophora]MDP4301349.1 tetratricopeptide repeat protein [Leptothrix discophora]